MCMAHYVQIERERCQKWLLRSSDILLHEFWTSILLLSITKHCAHSRGTRHGTSNFPRYMVYLGHTYRIAMVAVIEVTWMSHSNALYNNTNMTEPRSIDMQVKNQSSCGALNVGFDHWKEVFCAHLRMFSPVIGMQMWAYKNSLFPDRGKCLAMVHKMLFNWMAISCILLVNILVLCRGLTKLVMLDF